MKISWRDQKTGTLQEIADGDLACSERLDECHYRTEINAGKRTVDSIIISPQIDQYAFQLLSLRIVCTRDGFEDELVFVGSGGSDLGVLSYENLRFIQINGFTYFFSEEEGATLTLKLPPHERSVGRRYRVDLRVLVLDAKYVASFRQHLVGELRRSEQEVAELQSRLNETEDFRQRAENAEQRLRIMQQSRIWKLAESFRGLVYERLLGSFPGLRSRLLNWSRAPVRDSDENGPGGLGVLKHDVLNVDERHQAYHQHHQNSERQRLDFVDLAARIAAFEAKPKISVVMPVHNTPLQWLSQAVDSVLNQRYENFELCLCDDGSDNAETLKYLKSLNHPAVKLVRMEEAANISAATNQGVEITTGDYVAFMDHDDILDEDALFHVCQAINDADADIVYTDEDYIGPNGELHHPNFKPDYSPDLLLSHNYITHLLVVRKSLLDSVGGLNSEYDGCQDYDLVLRLTEVANRIVHVPKVLYHWRQSEQSTSLKVSAKPYVQERTRKLLQDTMTSRGESAEVLNANLPHYFYTRRVISDEPSVTIIVPFRDEPLLLESCLNSVLSKTTWSEYEILGINNQSESPLTFELMDAFSRNPRVRFIDYDKPFNFSAIVNHGVANAYGDYVVLLNNDIELITWDWLEAMLCHAQSPHCGVVGGKLFYPDNTVQHAGIIVGIGGYAGHGHKHFQCHDQGYGNRLNLVQNVSAVTGAFMMVNRGVFNQVGGFDAESFPIACNDVDFCLRVMEAGYWNVFTPHAQAYHLESASRGYEVTEERRKRFDGEKAVFQARYASFLDAGDPFYNLNLSLENEAFMVRP